MELNFLPWKRLTEFLRGSLKLTLRPQGLPQSLKDRERDGAGIEGRATEIGMPSFYFIEGGTKR